MSSNSNFDRNLSLQLSLPRDNVCVQTPVALSDLRHVDNTYYTKLFSRRSEYFFVDRMKVCNIEMSVGVCLWLSEIALPHSVHATGQAGESHSSPGAQNIRRNRILQQNEKKCLSPKQKMTRYFYGSVRSLRSGNLRLSVPIISSLSQLSHSTLSKSYFIRQTEPKILRLVI